MRRWAGGRAGVCVQPFSTAAEAAVSNVFARCLPRHTPVTPAGALDLQEQGPRQDERHCLSGHGAAVGRGGRAAAGGLGLAGRAASKAAALLCGFTRPATHCQLNLCESTPDPTPSNSPAASPPILSSPSHPSLAAPPTSFVAPALPLPQIDRFLYSTDNQVVAGALLAVGIVSCGVLDEVDPALALLSGGCGAGVVHAMAAQCRLFAGARGEGVKEGRDAQRWVPGGAGDWIWAQWCSAALEPGQQGRNVEGVG